MKRSIFLLLTLAPMLALASTGMAQAEKPAPPLTGTTEYDFVGHLGIFDAEGRLLAWEGTISGDIEGVVKWWMGLPTGTGQASHYVDRFEIWNAAETVLLLAVEEAGTTTVRPGKTALWRANGIVTEASEEFQNWIGCTTHNSGDATWVIPGVLPDHGSGTFRINSAPPLTGTTEYDFVGHLGIFDAEGRLLAWQGTISGDIEGTIKWWMVWPPSAAGQVSHFVERFEIWNAAETVLLLAVEEAGTTTVRPGKTALWRANGIVTEASEEFQNWIGSHTHNSGDATWVIPGVLPDYGSGTFRVN